MPIYYDIEDKSVINVGKQKLTDIIKEFCETIEANGYKAGVYASKSVFDNNFYKDQLSQYSLWVASYGNNTGDVPQGNEDLYKGQYNLWQYSSVVATPGLNRKGDANIMYDDVPTPVPPTPTPTPSYDQAVYDYQVAWNKTYGSKYGNILEDGIFGSQTEWSKTKVYLAFGSKNALVGWCQNRLKYHKGYSLAIDNIYGSETKSVVIQFQKDNRPYNPNLAVDGIIGYDTISILF